jgi:flagellar biosynthesis protein FlhF
MITRTVRAENMLTALEVIKKELGPDALVVSVRQIMSGPSWQVWRKPLVEVVAVRLVEGEPAEQLKTAIAQHKQSSSKDDKPDAAVGKKVDDAQSQALDETFEALPSDEPGKRPSIYAKRYQPVPVIAEEDQNEVLLPDKPGSLPDQVVLQPGHKEISKPIFERINSNTPKKVIEPEEVEMAPLLDFPPRGRGPMPTDIKAAIDLPPMVLKTYQYLLRHGLDDSLLQRAAQTCADTLPPRAVQDKKRVWDSMQQQLESVIRVQKETLSTMPRVIFLTGTSGVGKTSSIAKLAVHLSANEGRKVGWVCADTIRIGALGEARTYAETIGVPLQVVYTPDELQNAINLFLNEVEFILVDTPAFNPRNEQSIVELGEMLSAYPGRSTWVVIPATAKESDLQNTLATIGSFKPRGLLVSKLDETNNFSAAYNIAWRSQLPLTYFTFGSHVINDLIPARGDLMVKAIFDERFMA